MNILLAFLLYRNMSFSEMASIKPFLPVKTQRSLSALEAYNNSDCLEQCTDTEKLINRLPNSGFPYVLLRLFAMGGSSQDNMFNVLKQILPQDIARNIPDPETLMNIMNIMSAMNFSDCETEDCSEHGDNPQNEQTNCSFNCNKSCDDFCPHDLQSNNKKNECCDFNERQLSFFKKFIKDL